MEKYLGNKRVLLKNLYSFINENCEDSKSLCDIFAGTTNVGRFFNNKGFKVFSNDVNRFSYIIGRCYFGFNHYPTFSKLKLPAKYYLINQIDEKYFNKLINKDAGLLLSNFDLETFIRKNKASIGVLNYLNDIQSYRKPGNEIIKDYYTVFGSKSDFKSVRGSKGKRNYFSYDNVVKLDLILEQIREWYQSSLITDDEISLLMTSIIEEVVLVANVSGTFHDFNREKLWPNSLQKLTLKLPLFELSNGSQIYCDDALNIIHKIPQHDILYIDPPYNFRQYSSYYHFINFLSAYPFLISINNYVDNIEFVRGQNMLDDFTSDFCIKDKFIDSLRKMISNSNSKYVIMSYYGGRNHWNHWSKEEEPNDFGFQEISTVFTDMKLFNHYRAESLFHKRQNYQSRVGEKKNNIDEYLFFGERVKSVNGHRILMHNSKNDKYVSLLNNKFDLNFFRPVLTTKIKTVK